MARVDLEAFRWLLTDPGQDLLDRAAELYDVHVGDPVRTATALRRPPTSPRSTPPPR